MNHTIGGGVEISLLFARSRRLWRARAVVEDVERRERTRLFDSRRREDDKDAIGARASANDALWENHPEGASAQRRALRARSERHGLRGEGRGDRGRGGWRVRGRGGG